MSDDLHRQIYGNMNFKDTEELLEIWNKNNRAEWTDQAFDVVREILESRIGMLPSQGNAVFSTEEETEAATESREDVELDLEDWEAKLVDSDSQPTFYDTLEVIELRRNINRMARVIVILSILWAIFSYPTMQSLIRGYFPTNDHIITAFVASIVAIAIGVGLNIIFMYYPLKALAHILRVLMEMEFNSRK